MKKIILLILSLTIAFATRSEVIKLDYNYHYESGNDEYSFMNETQNSTIYEWDFGLDRIYGYQLVLDLDLDRSYFSGTSQLDVNVNFNNLQTINLNYLTLEKVKLSYYGIIDSLDEPYLTDDSLYRVIFTPFKEINTRIFADAFLYIATEPEDKFSFDTRNAPYLNVSNVSTPSTFFILLLPLCALILRRKVKHQ